MIPRGGNVAPTRDYVASGDWDGAFIDDYLATAAAAVPDRMALAEPTRSLTFAEFDAAVNALASALQAHGIAPGDVVSWQLPNWIEACVVHLAAIRIGAVSNPIIPIYRHTETAFILRQSASRIVFVPSVFRNFDYAAMACEIARELDEPPTVVVVGEGSPAGGIRYDAFVDGAEKPNRVDRSPDDVMLLLYTSGTTSDPKGAMHSHNTLNYENRSIADLLELSESDVIFMPSPVGHITGILYGIQLPPMLRSGVALLDVWSPQAGMRLIDEYRCTTTVAATPFLHGIVHDPSGSSHDLSSMRNFLCGGADVPPDLVIEATDTLDALVARVYGSTEFPTASAGKRNDPLTKRATTDGRAIKSAEIRIVDDDMQDVTPGIPGEILLRGPEMFLGYLDNRLNDSAFTADGWFRSGDLGRLDTEGYLEIVGRKKDIIIRGGENLSAKEVEDHLFAHPMIADVAVVGSPDPVLGERVCAIVVPEPEVDIELEHLTGWLIERNIARQKLPESLIVVDELPRTASGKIQKFKLRELAADRAKGTVHR
ncbi:AMP-binding protein [Rhodococcus pyridinivorans]|uniref:Acid-CoA ligase n=1 Tax=Rhodococcus pyridinivorans AK37 TaxID=1114960 RepID=H0JLS2_9NOCA|nr:AMP-binding protein [Rhodococcus pyridinivorans]EHK85824.1 acid-CoA ligase [Rhodococcus pyridinivorans AK37]MCD2143508.1 AMP-binding protein [Rhodococcus pyridinivorans]